MTEDVQNLTQEIQEQTVNSAKDFYGNALGQVKGQLESSRSELEGLMEQIPEDQEDARSQLQELIDSYESITNAVDEAAQTQGVEDTVQGAVDQAQEAAGQAAEQAQDAAGGAAEQAQDAAGGATEAVGQVAGQAQDAAGQATEAAQDLAPGTQLLGETVND